MGKRRGAERVPHLSTIDAILFLAQIGGSFQDEAIRCGILVEGKRLSINHVLLRAGTAPIENLSSVRLSGSLIARNDELRGEIRIGNMRTVANYQIVTCDTDCVYRSNQTTARDTPKLDLRQVSIDAETNKARSAIVANPVIKPTAPGEIFLVANIVACSQVAQALIATLDGIPREKSNTLWMRRYEGWVIFPQTGQDSVAEVIIDDHRVRQVTDRQFSLFDGHARSQSVESQFSIAHSLPRGHT